MTFGLSDVLGAVGAASGAAAKRALPPQTVARDVMSAVGAPESWQPAAPAPAPDSTWGQDFRNRLAEYRADAAQHPYANLAGTLVGGLGSAGTLTGASGASLPASLPAAPADLASAGPFAARPLAAARLAEAPGVVPPPATTPGLLARTLAGGAGGAAAGAVTGWAGSDNPLSPDMQTLKQTAWPAAVYGVAGGLLPGVGATGAPLLRAVEPYASAAVPHLLGAGAGSLIQHLTGVGGEGGMFAAPLVGERGLTPAIAKLWDATAGRLMRNPTALSSIGGAAGATVPAIGQAVTPWWATPGAGTTP
jgi:hypothetical protein